MPFDPGPPGRALVLLPLLLALGCAQPDAPAPPGGLAEAVEPGATATPASPTTPDAPAATDSTVTVVFFGDSLTAGYGLADPDADAYPALVGARLDAAGIPATVVNAGSSGETTAGGLRRVDWILDRTPPDVFVLALGGNDGLRGTDVDAMEANLDGILEKVREAAPEARLVVAGIEALPNYGAGYTERFRAVFPAVAARHDAALVPFLLDGVAGVAALNQPDGVHPTAEGQRRLAATVAPTVLAEAQQAARDKVRAAG